MDIVDPIVADALAMEGMFYEGHGAAQQDKRPRGSSAASGLDPCARGPQRGGDGRGRHPRGRRPM